MLLRQYLRREAASLVGWSLAIPVLVFPLVGIYRLMLGTGTVAELSRMLEELPPALRTLMGADLSLTTLEGWLLDLVFGFLVPLLLTVYTGLAALGVLTREVDGGTMDFLLSLPVRRSEVLLSRLGGLLVNLLVFHGVVLASVGGAVTAVGEVPRWDRYALILLNQYLIYASLAAVLVLVTVWVDDLQKGMLTTLGLSLGMFFLTHTVPSESPLAAVRWLSLFQYYRPGEILSRGAPPASDVTVLLLVGVAAAAGAVWLFNRKQISA